MDLKSHIQMHTYSYSFPPIQTKQKVEQVKAIPITHSRKLWKAQTIAGWDGANLDESWRKANTASMLADRSQTSQGIGTAPKPIPAPPWDNLARNLGRHCREWSWGKTDSETKFLHLEMANCRVSKNSHGEAAMFRKARPLSIHEDSPTKTFKILIWQ